MLDLYTDGQYKSYLDSSIQIISIQFHFVSSKRMQILIP